MGLVVVWFVVLHMPSGDCVLNNQVNLTVYVCVCVCIRAGCRQSDHPTHHLTCITHKGGWTKRHTDILNSLHKEMVRVSMAKHIGSREVAIPGVNSTTLRADIVATFEDEDEPEYVDVGITAMKSFYDGEVTWPTNDEVKKAVEVEKAQPKEDPLFFWEDHSKENPHPETVLCRKFRQLANDKCAGAAIRAMDRDKVDKYRDKAGVEVRPFILSAGGAVGHGASEILRTMTKWSYGGLREKSEYRKELTGNMSATLVKWGFNLAMYHMNVNCLVVDGGV